MIKINYKNNLPEKLEYIDAINASETLLDNALLKAHKDINNITSYISKSHGKGIRTKLLLASSIQSDGLVSLDAARAAAAVEILHLATLIHDDVIDNAKMRRGMESVQTHFGKREAVISGDYLFCLAYSIISQIDQKYAKEDNIRFASKVSDMVSDICIGELNQYKNNNNVNLSIMKYLKIISGKTASLFSISSYAGAIIGECSEDEVNSLLKFGKYLGMIFQIIDDCKDYEYSEDRAKKSVKKDIEQGVITLPLIMSAAKYPEVKKLFNEALLNGDRNKIINEVHKTGGTKEAVKVASKYYLKAKNILNNINNEKKCAILLDILCEGSDAYKDILNV